MFKEKALVLRAGEICEFEVPGRLLLLKYVSSQESGRLKVTTDGDEIVFDTLHEKVASGDYTFLIRSLFLYNHDWTCVEPGRQRRIVLQVLRREDPGEVTLPQRDMVAPTADKPAVYPFVALCV